MIYQSVTRVNAAVFTGETDDSPKTGLRNNFPERYVWIGNALVNECHFNS